MTVQIKEKIIYKGEMAFTDDHPLDDYIAELKEKIKKDYEKNPEKVEKL